MVDKRRGCNPRIVEQVTLYDHLRTLSSDLPSSEVQSSSLDRSSSASKKTARAPFHVLWKVRGPVRASDSKGSDLPESEFVSDWHIIVDNQVEYALYLAERSIGCDVGDDYHSG